MKIAFFVPWEVPDGIYTYTDFLTAALKKLDVGVEVVPQQNYQTNLSLFSSQTEQDSILEAAGRLSQADLAHVQHEFGLIGNWKNPFDQTLKILLTNISVPKVITMHGFHPWMLEMDPTRPHPPFRSLKKLIRFLISQSPWARYTFGKVFSLADKIIVHNRLAKEHLVGLGVSESKTVVVPHGVAALPALGKPAQGCQFREKYQINPEAKLLTIFGFVDYSKGYELVLDILSEIPPEYILVIAGGTRLAEQKDYKVALEEMIKQGGLQNRVVFTGFLKEREIPVLMDETEILLVPQRYANTSGSLHLGLGAGKAIVASDLEFAREINQRVECLSLFERGNAFQLKDKILQLVKAPDGRQVLETKAREYARKFSWGEVAKLHLKVYADCISG